VIAGLNQGIGRHKGIKANCMGSIKASAGTKASRQIKLYGLNQGIGRHKGIKANCMDQIVWVVNDDVTGTAISIAAGQSPTLPGSLYSYRYSA
jgi:hypothetical protein